MKMMRGKDEPFHNQSLRQTPRTALFAELSGITRISPERWPAVFKSPISRLDCRLSDEGYSDDEDTSWKVRRAAAKALSTIIAMFPNLLQDVYPSSCRALVVRFKEREETVKVDAFNALVSLIQQVRKILGTRCSPAVVGDELLFFWCILDLRGDFASSDPCFDWLVLPWCCLPLLLNPA